MVLGNAEITPDLVEWLVADPQVAAAWRSIALAVDLKEVVPTLEVSRRTRRTDRHRLKEFLEIWKLRRPQTYNVPSLIAVLDSQGLKSMASWVRLMTDTKLEASQLREYVQRRLQGPPLHCTVRSEGRLTPRPRSAMFYSAPASPHHQLFVGHGHQPPPPSCSWSSQASPSPSPSPRASPSPQREIRGRGGVFATLYRPEQGGGRQGQARNNQLCQGHAGEEGRRHSLAAEQQQLGEQQSRSEQRRHSLGLVMTRPNDAEVRELPTILESPAGLKPYEGFDALLHISESPSRPLTDLECALQKLENEGKPLQDFDSALESYREGLAGRSRGSSSFDFGILNSVSGQIREGKPRPVSVATVEGKFDGQYRAEKYFDKFEACNKIDRLEGGNNMGTGKYFDNLVAMIEGSMRGLEL